MKTFAVAASLAIGLLAVPRDVHAGERSKVSGLPVLPVPGHLPSPLKPTPLEGVKIKGETAGSSTYWEGTAAIKDG